LRSEKQAGLIALFVIALVAAPVCATACAALTCAPAPAETANEHHHGAPAPDDSDAPSHTDCCGAVATTAVLARRATLNPEAGTFTGAAVAIVLTAVREFDFLHAARVRDHSPPRSANVFLESVTPLRV
jgi:hypothetical protein